MSVCARFLAILEWSDLMSTMSASKKGIPASLVAFAVIAVVVGGYLGYSTFTSSRISSVPVGGQSMLPTKTITIGNEKLVVEIASTPEEQQSGLSGRSGLAAGTGMLFIFTPPSVEGFWMKDMLFSLDIIWADSNGVIVTIDKGLSPDTYPKVFMPDVPAQYVLEVPAGYAASKGIAVGQKIVVQ